MNGAILDFNLLLGKVAEMVYHLFHIFMSGEGVRFFVIWLL